MIHVKEKANKIFLDFDITLINVSSNHSVNLYTLADTLKKQIETVYTGNIGVFEMHCQVAIRPFYKYKLKQLYGKLVFAVADKITNENVAEADFCGSLVKLNAKHIASFISGNNSRTIPHEVGHLLGFDHPHAKAMFDSVNPGSSLYEKNMTEAERRVNLMSQSWYIQKAGNALNKSVLLTENQVRLLLENFYTGKLNKNYSLIKKFIGYKWVSEM